MVDRFGDVLVVQANAAGIDRLEAPLVAALRALLSPTAIVLRNDSGARGLEGLALETRVVHGMVAAPVRVEEGGVRFQADVVAGQKTGWFYDQRDNRAICRRARAGRRVLDLYSYAGGFALRAAQAGADAVLGIDRSAPALALAGASAELNGVAELCRFRRGDVFAERAALTGAGRALRRRDRRSAGLRPLEEGCAGGAARLSQAGAAGRRADRAGRLRVSRLVLAQCRRRRICRGGAARSRRCRAVRAHPAELAAPRRTIRCIPTCPKAPI